MASAATIPAFSDEAVTRALAGKNRAFEAHYNAGDARGLVETYFVSDRIGAAACPPGGQAPVEGREALVALFSGMIADAPSIELRSESIVTSGDIAFELGRAFLQNRDGTSAIGRFTVCWVREDGDWRAKTDFFAQDGWEDGPDKIAVGAASTARVRTPKASNYLQQVCKHWSHRFEARFDAGEGHVDFGDSSVTLKSADGELVVTVNAAADQLSEIEGVVAEHINRFAHREGNLRFEWMRD